MGDCSPLIDAATLSKLNDKAEIFNDDLESIERSTREADRDGLPEAKHRSKAFVDEALALPSKDEQTCLLKTAEALGDSRRELNFDLPQLDLVFSHKDDSLAKAQLSYPIARSGIVNSPAREVIDIFAP